MSAMETSPESAQSAGRVGLGASPESGQSESGPFVVKDYVL